MFSKNGVHISAGICGVLAAGTVLRTRDNESESKKSHPLYTRKTALEGYKLKQVQIFVRHGARTPIHTLSTVQEANYDRNVFMGDMFYTTFNHDVSSLEGAPRPFSPYDAHYQKEKHLRGGSIRGSLTKLGQHQMFKKGQLYRNQYVDEAGLIDDIYNPEQVHIRSTNVNRTIITARCIAAGLFGAENLNKLNAPLKIYTEGTGKDCLVPRTNKCHVLRQINHLAMIHCGDWDEFKQDRLDIESALGITTPDTDPKKHKLNFIDVRDDIVARETHGMGGIEQVQHLRDKIEKHASTVMYYAFCGHEREREVAMQLSTGPALKMVIDNIDNADKTKTKLFIYSCHDSTLVGLLGTLDVYDFIWPPFGSDVRFELYENSKGERFIRVSYEGKDVIARGCSDVVSPVSELKEGLKPYIIDDKTFWEICDSDILDRLVHDVMEKEKGEVEDEETAERSDTPAGM